MPENSHSASNLAAGATAQERRASARYSFSATAEAVHLQADTRLSGRVSDLGRGGCYVDTINPFPVGADVKIRILKDNASFVAQARVMYAASGMGMGLAFTKIEPERLKILEGWLAELSGEAPREAKALDLEDQPPETAALDSGNEHRYVLSELILTLIRKQVLTDAEGKALLQKLMQ
jgi:hypothetical protein